MKISEILIEDNTGSLALSVAKALPGTYELTKLKNQDPYLQYRMGLALAGARSGASWEDQSAFGENMSVIAYTKADEETLMLALKLIGKEYGSDVIRISSEKSEESSDVNTKSPLAVTKKNRFGI